MDLKELDILGENIQNHWYYVAKERAMRRFLGDIKAPEVLDVGAGSGVFSRYLLDAGVCGAAFCLDLHYPEEKTESHNGKRISFIKSTDNTSYKLIIMMDVMEHVEDDVGFLKQYIDNLEPGGHILITVPAFQFIWSGHDVYLEHHRRYTIDQLESVVKKAGITPIKSRYFFGTLFPVVAGIRLIKNLVRSSGNTQPKSELRLYPKWLNNALILTHDIERNTIFDLNKAFGLSLFCLCRKT